MTKQIRRQQPDVDAIVDELSTSIDGVSMDGDLPGTLSIHLDDSGLLTISFTAVEGDEDHASVDYYFALTSAPEDDGRG